MNIKQHHLSNDLWALDLAPEYNGRVSRLIDRSADEAVRAEPPKLAAGVLDEGGSVPFFGLDIWIKSGAHIDPNTGVRSAFAPIHGTPVEAQPVPDGVRMRMRAHGLEQIVEWRLPPGAQPLECRLELINHDASPDTFQWEGLFMWRIEAERWSRMAACIPGLAPLAMQPFGDIDFAAASSADGDCAFWWERGTQDGVAMQAATAVDQFFAGIKSHTFVMGPHSRAIRLERGERMAAGFSIAPLKWAINQGWRCDPLAAEGQLEDAEKELADLADDAGSLEVWTRPAEPPAAPAVPRRALHLTLQYAPVDLRQTIDLLEKVVAPAGYNQLIVEVGRAFPYQSHPTVKPDWAWDRDQWKTFVKAARDLGLDLIPQYNALAHQGESGLAAAYPEMREDEKGWCLCPRHPKTIPYLLDLCAELVDCFEPRYFNLGIDEIDIPSRPQTFCVCPRCRDTDGGRLLADHVQALYTPLAAQGMEVMMWADMLLYKPEHNSTNGIRTGTWRAIDHLPRELILLDWVYFPVDDYGGARYLRSEGFRVMGATWFHAGTLIDYTRFAVSQGLWGMTATTWATPTMMALPMISILLAGKQFAQPSSDPVAAENTARAFARRLSQQ